MPGKMKRGKAVTFNGDISPGMSGPMKAGVASPMLEKRAASMRGYKRSKKRSGSRA